MKNGINTCRKCGKPIGIITEGIYRKVVVDLEPLMITPDENGEDYVRLDGSKVRGRVVAYESGETAEPAYRMHRKTCGGEK